MLDIVGKYRKIWEEVSNKQIEKKLFLGNISILKMPQCVLPFPGVGGGGGWDWMLGIKY